MSFLSLPTEILIRILVNLDVKNAFSVQCVCRFINDVYKESCELQYAIECEMAGVEDNPSCTLPIASRLEMLREREQRWNDADPSYSLSVSPPRPTSGLYDVSDECAFLGMATLVTGERSCGVQSYRIPLQQGAVESDNWTFFQVNGLIDFSCCIEEHDLFVCLSSIQNTSLALELHLHLFEYSTGRPHPLAVEGGIHVVTGLQTHSHLAMTLEVSGDNLVLILKADASWYRLYVFDWKTGKSKNDPISVSNTGVVMLRHDLFLNPNLLNHCLDIYHIESSPNVSVRRIHRLGLPAFTSDVLVLYQECRSAPNPTGDDNFPKYLPSSRPFRERPEEALIIFTWDAVLEFDGRFSPLTMVVHRKSLMDQLPPRSTWSTLQSTDDIQNWTQWGPNICQWFERRAHSTFITISHGQRFVEWDGSAFVIRSFNPYHIKKVRYDIENAVYGPDPVATATKARFTHYADPGVFEDEEVVNKLESVEVSLPIASSAGFMMNGVALLNTDTAYHTELFYFG